MAVAPQTGRVTPADDLRQLLSQSEERLINLSDQASVAELYGWLDQTAAMLPQLQATGGDIRAEETRWQSLQERIATRGKRVLRAWQGSGRLAEARQAANPDPSQWWWWIDQRLAEQRRRRLRQVGGVGLAAMAIVVAVILVFQRLFPVDPIVRQSYRLQLQAEAALANANLEAGYQALSEAIAINPTNVSLLILHGVVADVLGDGAVAEQSWQQARDLLQGDEGRFFVERGQSYLRVQQAGRAIEDLSLATDLNPDSARAQLVLGGALDAAGRYQEALAAFERASELAEAAGNSELTVMARAQMANLLPRLQAAPMPTTQP